MCTVFLMILAIFFKMNMLIIVCRTTVSKSLYLNKKRIFSKNIMSKSILKKFGKRVREERIKQNLSQEELAERANVHRTYIGMIERAEKNITLENIEKIAKALNIRIKTLLND